MDVYLSHWQVIILKTKQIGLRNILKKGYTDIAFMDDSIKNVRAVQKLQKKYPNVRIKSVLAVEHLKPSQRKEILENYIQELYTNKL